jgi:hypothetical protein
LGKQRISKASSLDVSELKNINGSLDDIVEEENNSISEDDSSSSGSVL